MGTIILLGAGQMGQAAYRLVNRAHYTVTAFADNNPALWGGTLCGCPILSVEDAAARAPDGFLIAVAGQDRTEALRAQLRALGYAGEVRALSEYMEALDIRGAVLSLLAERMEHLPGAVAELGVYRGDFAALLSRAFPRRTLYLFDTFEGFDPRDVGAEAEKGYSRAAEGAFANTSVDAVLSKLAAPENAVVRKGYFPETAAGLDPDLRFCLVSLDADLYTPTLSGLRWFYPRLAPGGVLLVHDYWNARFSGVRAAVEAFEAERGRLLVLPVGDLHGSAMVVRT